MTDGLTVVGDIPLLYEELSTLKKSIIVEFELLNQQIDDLKDIVFESLILLDADTDWDVVRKKRDFILKSTDWTLTPGSSLDQSAWAEYRQQLRDLPQRFKENQLNKLVWPVQPPMSGPNTIEA
jgi:hypothetical protein